MRKRHSSGRSRANTKMIVRPTRRMIQCDPLGVFCRSAPSTSLPCGREGRAGRGCDAHANSVRRTAFAGHRRVIAADSRMTGVDLPVQQLVDRGMPSITSASDGIRSASTRTMSSTFNWVEGASRSSQIVPGQELACVAALVAERLRRALPRPSATAVAKSANSTVNDSHKMI